MDDNYDPLEIFPDTDKEIMANSNDNYGEGEYISAAEVVAAVRATRHEAEPIGTLKEDHIDPRQRRLVFLRSDYNGVATLRLVNSTIANTRPTLSTGARGTRGSVKWLQVDYFASLSNSALSLSLRTKSRNMCFIS